MTDKPENPPAFPVPSYITDTRRKDGGRHPTLPITCEGGMTLRDWFAGQALPRALSAEYYDSRLGFGSVVDGREHERAAAEAAYRIADAMLAVRERKL